MNIIKFLGLCILCAILYNYIYQESNKKPPSPTPIVAPIVIPIPEPNIPKPLPVIIVPEVPVYIHILYDNYVKSLELGKYFKKKTIIIFSADWCGYCKKLKENIEQLDQPNDYVICILNVDLQDNKYLLEKYKIKSLPTSIILDTTLGEPSEISRKTGFNKSDYIQWVKQKRM
jgi:thiol-disulfide isomerase/thioredoxin